MNINQAKKKLQIPDDIICIAVVKYMPLEQIKRLVEAGFTDLGWNTVRHFIETVPLISASPKSSAQTPNRLRHHFIGHLQTNKVGKLLDCNIALIHSVDSERLMIELEKQAAKRNKTQNILLQIKTDEEKTHGFTHTDAEKIIKNRTRYPHLHMEGIMTIPPPRKNPEDNRMIFRAITNFAHQMEKKYHHPLPHISMGMSGDYQIAIEEGATMVRIGSLLGNL